MKQEIDSFRKIHKYNFIIEVYEYEYYSAPISILKHALV